MNKYKFTKKINFWNADHHTNFAYIKQLFSNTEESQLNFLEIGVFEGRTSCWLIDNILSIESIHRSKGMLHCIDPYIAKNGEYNLRQHLGDIIFYREPSGKVLIDLIKDNIFRFDFIYVDGDHNACNLLEDLILSWKLLKVGGIMLIDDYEMETTDPWHYISHAEFNKDNPKLRFTHPRIAIDAFLNIYRGQFDWIIDNYQIGIKKTLNLS
jgi:predicted O-methyltransferase YrrM